ncbi:hypothetical protein, partial [Mycobacterium intracellulare]|uniref:hypothetical protein n=1 Tax=Mycobacterium intracellulare TaxID=1767 RepID=UPI00197C02C3
MSEDRCIHDHSLDDAYVVREGRRLRRRCRPCQKAANRDWYARNRERISRDRAAKYAAALKAAEPIPVGCDTGEDVKVHQRAAHAPGLHGGQRMSDYSTADIIKNVYARVAAIQPVLVAEAAQSGANLAWAAEKLTALLADLAGHLNAIGADCGRYDDGRAVVSKA